MGRCVWLAFAPAQGETRARSARAAGLLTAPAPTCTHTHTRQTLRCDSSTHPLPRYSRRRQRAPTAPPPALPPATAPPLVTVVTGSSSRAVPDAVLARLAGIVP
eukprot:3932079-Rhodomonas_salina.3